MDNFNIGEGTTSVTVYGSYSKRKRNDYTYFLLLLWNTER